MGVEQTQILKVEFSELKFCIANIDGAEKLTSLYRKVYGTDYPCPELFTTEGMKEFLDFSQSNAVTMVVYHNNEVIAAATCQLNGRLVYSRGFMVAPAWQGKINARRAFQHIMLLFRTHFNGQADLIYGEARTENSKIQDILEEIGCQPVAILPRKDIFYGKRETEIISVWYYQKPQPGPLCLTMRASQIAEKILQHPVQSIEKQYNVPFAHPSNYRAVEKRESNSDSHLFIKLPSGAELSAIICYQSANSEKVKIHVDGDHDFYYLVYAYLKEIRVRKIEYAEIYIDAQEHVRQWVVEGLGFNPTGFLVHWYAPGENDPQDYVVYTKHWQSLLPDCPIQFTKQGEFLKNFVDLPTPDETIPRLDGALERMPTINDLS